MLANFLIESCFCRTMEFSRVSQTLLEVEKTPSKLEMAEILSGLFKKANPEEVAPLAYLLTGRVRPEYEEKEFGLSSQLLIEALSQASRFPRQEVEEVLLKEGDIGKTAQHLMERGRQTTLFSTPLTLLHVYDKLTAIADATGPGSQEKKMRILAGVLHDGDPLDARFTTRMVRGKLRIGSASMIIIDALSLAFASKEERDEIEEAYNRCSDLGRVAQALSNAGMEGVRNVRVSVGTPLRPMLAERLGSLEAILEKLGGTALFEYKYDGLRVQAHISETVSLFSRRMENITDQFPDIAKALEEAFLGEEAIVEGEAVPVGPGGEFLPFQRVSRRRGRKHDLDETIEEVPVKFLLFDCLYCDGEEWLSSSQKERRDELERIFEPSEKVEMSKGLVTDEPEKAEEFFNEALEMGAEGVMAKSLDPGSRYRAGARGWQWVKFKADYQEGLLDSFDCIVVGGYHGRGRRTGYYGALLMAVMNEDTGNLETLCKLGSGLTDKDLEHFKEKLDRLKSEGPSRVLDYVKIPDVWFEPEICLEIMGAELSVSPDHTACKNSLGEQGLALRFPRYTGRERTDKGIEEATTAREVFQMYQKQKKSL